MDKMIAYCGLSCVICPIYLATIEKDKLRQQTMRVAIAKECSEKYGMNLRMEDITDCDGCRAGTGRLFSGCSDCAIRKCAMSKNVESCADCADFICFKLGKHFLSDPDAQARLKKLKSN